jgi:hypothetical protein
MDPSIYAKRKRANFIGLVLSMSAMAIGLIFLLWILLILTVKGFSALNFDLLFKNTPAPGTEGGGLANAIVEEVRNSSDDYVFETIIHRNSRIAEAPMQHTPVALYDVSSKGATNFFNLAEEFLRKNQN